VIEGAFWAVGIVGVLFFGRVFLLLNSANVTPYEVGYLAGSMATALAIGLVVGWALRKRRGGGRLMTPSVLFVAVAVLIFARIGQVREENQPVVGLPIATYVVVDAPYSLAAAPPEVSGPLAESLQPANPRALEIRAVVLDGETLGFLVVADLQVHVDGLDEYLRGAEDGFEGKGGTAQREVIGGQDTVIGEAAGGAGLIWPEPPYAIFVYAADVASARQIGAAIISAYP
jgi:hypothetical protein